MGKNPLIILCNPHFYPDKGIFHHGYVHYFGCIRITHKPIECTSWCCSEPTFFFFFLEKSNKYRRIKDLRIYEGIYKQHLNIPRWLFRHPYALAYKVAYSSEFEVSLKASSGHWTQTHFVCQCQKKIIITLKNRLLNLSIKQKICPDFSLGPCFDFLPFTRCYYNVCFAFIWTATNFAFSLTCTFPSDLLMATFS